MLGYFTNFIQHTESHMNISIVQNNAEPAINRADTPNFLWQLPKRRLQFNSVASPLPLIMGILNVTPDSFSDGGLYSTFETACEHALELIAAGADLLDIGGESTRPNATPVPVVEELRRVVAIIKKLAPQISVPISIDTTKAEVAREALRAGASIVNDVSGLTFDPDMIRVCAEAQAGVICMHIQGTPQSMQIAPHYDDAVSEICGFLKLRLERLAAEGIPPERVVVDPGIGFGKTAQHNLEILSSIDQLHALGRPVCIGHSRKRFLKAILGQALDERSQGTVGVSIALAAQRTDILRVHDVAATRDALLAWHAVDSRVAGRATASAK